MKREVSPEQMNALLDFMGQHKNLTVDTLWMKTTLPTFRQLWNDLTSILNDCSTGCKKTTSEWRQFWSRFRSSIKNRLILLKKAKNGGNMLVRPLNCFEKRTLMILGPHLVRKKKNSGVVHLYVNTNSKKLPAVKSKLKKFRDSDISNTTTNNDCKDIDKSGENENKERVIVVIDSDEDVDDVNYTWYMS